MLKKMGIRRGVNLGGWLSQCDYSADRLANFITEKDFARIAAWGLDHVRIPVDYNVLEDEQGGYDAPGWERIDFALAQCEKHDLKAVIDLHKAAGFSFDKGERESGLFSDEKYQDRFCRLWAQIARRYGHLSHRVVFELLNEVTSASYIGVWNELSHRAIRSLRVYAPDTIVLVGSYHYNSAAAVQELAAPADDRVVYNFHCYEPLEYTHQGAPWVDVIDQSARIPFENCGANPEYFSGRWASAIEAAERNHTVLYCGEYGVINVVPTADALEWFKVINAAFEKHGIARCVWSYKAMDFGIGDEYWDRLRDELLKYL